MEKGLKELKEIIVPVFVNPFLFWFIDKNDVWFRDTCHRYISEQKLEKITDWRKIESNNKSTMVAVEADGLWARAFVIRPVVELGQYLCWFMDYGVPRLVQKLFFLPSELERRPALAKQGSLFNVVNLRREISLDDFDSGFVSKKTTYHVEGVRKTVLDCIANSKSLYFQEMHADKHATYGDIVLMNRFKEPVSLTEYLMARELIDEDPEMFSTIENSRADLKKAFLTPSQNWHQKLDRTETKHLDEILFNTEENTRYPMEYHIREQAHI